MIWARDRSRKKNYILKSEPFEIFINNSVNSLSLLLCYSSSNSVHLCILIRLCCLIFFANIYLYLLLPLTWSLHDLCVLSPSIISGRLLHTPYNSKYKIKIQNTHSNWGGGGGERGFNTKASCNFSSREGVRSCDKLMFSVLLQLAPATLCTSEYDHFVKKSTTQGVALEYVHW